MTIKPRTYQVNYLYLLNRHFFTNAFEQFLVGVFASLGSFLFGYVGIISVNTKLAQSIHARVTMLTEY